MKKKTILFPLAVSAIFLVACSNMNNVNSEQSSTSSTSSYTSSEVSSETIHSSSETKPSSEVSSETNVSETSSQEVTITVTGIELNYDSLNMVVGKSASLTYDIYPYEAENKEVTWESSDDSIVSVNDGILRAHKAGNVTITVTTVDGGYTDICEIKVVEEESSSTYTPEERDGVLIITQGGEFDITKNYEQIYVNAPDEDVVINLNGVTIENDNNSPIYVVSCNSIDISAKKGTTNYIKDTRDIYLEDVEGQGKGAIYVEDGDLDLKGKGTLYVSSTYLNGIHGKDDVEIKNLTLDITAVNHAVRGNDSVTVTSGTVNIVCGGDGFHSENSDISSKGNQRGNVTLSGGNITVNSWSDAVDAAYNAIIQEEDENVPLTFTAKTYKYSSYNGDVVDTSNNYLYLKMNSSTYSNGSYKYAALINDEWCEATYVGTQTSETAQQGGMGGRPGQMGGGSQTYYIYRLERPSNSSSFKLYRFNSNATISTTTYNAVSDLKAFNDNYDTVQISVSSSKISFANWSIYSTSLAAKGIKADNEIYITGGTIDIKSYDDAIHANNDSPLENGEKPLGNVHIEGGDITLYAADDGIHADNILYIAGGTTNITGAYEGLEANVMYITGGNTTVLATDDGVNACKGNYTPIINVSGGLLDVSVPTSGDTDGIDSNGNYTQTGGVVIIKGPGSASGQMGGGAAALDTDGSVSISNGTLAVFGSIEKTPNYSVTRTLCSSSTVSAGNKTISFSSANYTTYLKYSCSGCVVYSSLGTATLK